MDPALLLAVALLAFSVAVNGAEAALFTLASRAGPEGLPASVRVLVGDRAGVLTTILLVNLLANLGFFAAVHAWSENFPNALATALEVGALLVLLVISDLLPKMLGHRRPRATGRLAFPLVRGLHAVLGPALRPLAARLRPAARPAQAMSPEDAEALLHGEDPLRLPEEERGLVRHVLELGTLRAGALRVPLTRLLVVPGDEPLGLVRRRLEKAGAVYAAVTDGRGEVVGALDLTRNPRGARALDAMIRVPILPEVAPAANGLTLLRDSGAPFLLLVDEYGQASGAVPRGRWADTLLDRLPRSSGGPLLRETAPGRFIAEAALPLHDFADRFGAPGERDVRVETLGGLVSDRLGRVAREGDHLVFDGPGFRGEIWVARADETGPDQLEIWVRPEDEEPPRREKE